ncbi:MAG: hypothetical protein HYX46_03185 [Betaproteobacteria bacterium]|nr:hypothetical protein [Betaproteobacteria bacterium]
MNRRSRIASLMITLFGFACAAALVQAKDIPVDYTFCHAGTASVVTASKEFALTGVEFRGITRSNIEDKMLDNHTYHCVSVNRGGEQTANHGYCKFISPDGDGYFIEYSRVGTGEGTWKALAGGGRWKGLTGDVIWRVTTQGTPVSPGTYQACGVGKGKYRLPD